MNDPLVSIVIPTKNSKKTIRMTLDSIKQQSYSNIEIIVVDSYSEDNTLDISREFDVKIIQTKDKLLGARYAGLFQSKGELVLLLDSDQILRKSGLENAVVLMNKFDMLILEESTYNPKTWLQKMFIYDRKLIHENFHNHKDPLEGALLARLFKREILEQAMKSIPTKLLSFVIAHDHAIIYYETYKISRNVGFLTDALSHIEPSSLSGLWKKNYRYGQSTKQLVNSGEYLTLLKRKVRFRKRVLNWENIKSIIISDLLLLIKFPAYQLGYWKDNVNVQ